MKGGVARILNGRGFGWGLEAETPAAGGLWGPGEFCNLIKVTDFYAYFGQYSYCTLF